MKKLYQVELCRTSYVKMTIEAENKKQAEKLAWDELNSGEQYLGDNAHWDCESIEEVEVSHV